MGEGRQLAAHRALGCQIQGGDGHALTLLDPGQYPAPGVDDHAVAEGAAPAGVVSPLGRGQHEGQVLHRPGPQQQLPVREPCGVGEGGGQGDDVGGRPQPEQLREAQVVADPEAQQSPGQGMAHHLPARGHGRGLVILLLPGAKAKQMQLVVAAGQVTLGVDEQAAVVHLAGLVTGQRQGAGQDPDPELPGQPLYPGQQGVIADGDGQGDPRPLILWHQVEVLGQLGELGPLGRRLAQQRLGLGQVVV